MKTGIIGILVLLYSIAPAARADTINHIDASATVVGVESFEAQFNWDVTTQSVIGATSITASGPMKTTLPFFETIGDNFADWYGAGGAFQIDIRQFASLGAGLTFNDIGQYDAGTGHLEYYGAIPGVPGAAFGNWYGLTGTLTITDPPSTDVIATPESSTLGMLLCGLGFITIAIFIRGRRECC